MSCKPCDDARKGLSSDYRPECMECRARSIARSRAARDAWAPGHSGATTDLVAAIQRMLPQLSAVAGSRLVRLWWDLDQRQQGKA